jgi:hypothetical protein
MSLFVGNTYIKTEDIKSEYNSFDYYNDKWEEDAEKIKGQDVILKDDVTKIIDKIWTDVDSILKILEKHDLLTAINDLEVLLVKLE